MPLQQRLSQHDSRWYSTDRDVAHNFAQVCRLVAARLEDQTWPFLRDFCTAYKITQDQLGQACESFLKFVASSDIKEDVRVDQSLARSGWMDLPDPVQFAFLALLGTVLLGLYHVGVKEATIGGDGPCKGVKDLVDEARRVSEVITQSRWRRSQARWRSRLTRALAVLRGAR